MTDGSAEHASKPKVLIVDDNAQNLELLEAYMDDVPEAEVLTATNGLDALQKVAEANPDLILLDIMMPKMSGFEVCKKIKSDPKTRDIIVIMVTALNETGSTFKQSSTNAISLYNVIHINICIICVIIMWDRKITIKGRNLALAPEFWCFLARSPT